MAISRDDLSLRLRTLRKARGWSQARLGEESGTKQPQIQKLESGERELTLEWIKRLAPPMGYSVSDFIEGAPELTVNVVGYVGAGSAVDTVDAYPQGAGLKEVPCPRGLSPQKTVAVIVRGDSMAPMLSDGWLIFYSRDPESDAARVVGKLCVVQVAGGPIMVKQVRRGPTRGKFNLVSANAPMVEDVALEWASPVLAMMPPDDAESSA